MDGPDDLDDPETSAENLAADDLAADDLAAMPARTRFGALASALAFGLVVGLLAGLSVWWVAPRTERGRPAAAPSAIPTPSGPPGHCVWSPRSPGLGAVDPGQVAYALDRQVVHVGQPPGERRSGRATLTVATPSGSIVVAIDADLTPCTAASLAYLAAQRFYDGDSCAAENLLVVCGARDPDYTWPGENLSAFPHSFVTTPAFVASVYCDAPRNLCERLGNRTVTFPPRVTESISAPRGAVLLDNSGPGTNGGAFMVLTGGAELSAALTPFGRVTAGLDLLDKLGATGKLRIDSVTVTFG